MIAMSGSRMESLEKMVDGQCLRRWRNFISNSDDSVTTSIAAVARQMVVVVGRQATGTAIPARNVFLLLLSDISTAIFATTTAASYN